jgi:hypothetical protein
MKKVKELNNNKTYKIKEQKSIILKSKTYKVKE